MNTGRFVGAAIAVWIIRTAMNATFYGLVVGPRFEQVAAAHPGMFRTVIPAYVIADLIFAVVFTVLFTMVADPLGGGVRADITLGLCVALLAPVLGGFTNTTVSHTFRLHFTWGQRSTRYSLTSFRG